MPISSFKPQYSNKQILKWLKEKPAAFWEKVEKEKALKLFHQAAKKVPAYEKFLRQKQINPQNIKSWADFKKVPPINKKNYLQKFSLKQLAMGGELLIPSSISATSGSTGEPFYFLRSQQVDWEYATELEMYLRHCSYGYKKPTLVIITLGMGVWIGGVITYKAFDMLAQKGYPLFIITPGVNKEAVLNALKRLSPYYYQTILAGYPPFVKDIIDEAHEKNVLPQRIRLLFAAETFTENFRDYLADKTSIKNIYTDTMNIYGTADRGAIAHETPPSILIRRIAANNQKLAKALFRQSDKMPTLAQYNPLFISFEEQNGEILFTTDNTIPLIRYAIGDSGGVISFKQMNKLLEQHTIDLNKEIKKASLEEYFYQLPFVYVFERRDMSVSFYGLLVYPEPVREALLNKKISPYLTGKFTMAVRFNHNHNAVLEINLELRKHQKPPAQKMQKFIAQKITDSLCQKSSEYNELSKYLKKRALPKLKFWPYEHPKYFRPGGKQKWVAK